MIKFGMDPNLGQAATDLAKAYLAGGGGKQQGQVLDSPGRGLGNDNFYLGDVIKGL
jgi:hypothetical protein